MEIDPMTTPSTAGHPGTMALRILAGFVGAGLIACVTYAAVMAIGGIAAPTAPLLIALACGLAAGAMAAGIAWRSGRKALAIAIGLAMLTGEAYTLLNTGERELEAREAKQAPVIAAQRNRARLAKALEDAQAAAVIVTPRLTKALAVQEAVRADAREKIAGASCVKLCHALLREQQAAADAEVEAARGEVATLQQAASENVRAATVALAAIPVVASVSPLAARLGVADWRLDLLRAGLFSVSANGLGAFLLAFAGHGGQRRRVPSVADSLQTSFAPPDHGPRGGPRKRRKRERLPATVTPKSLPNNVVSIVGNRRDIVSTLSAIGRPATVSELGRLMGVTKGEASRRWREAGNAVTAERRGRFVFISLRSARAA
jgi:hypothetical protein